MKPTGDVADSDVEFTMSSVPHPPNELGYAGLRMTAVEFLAIGETKERLELVDGIVCMSPRPTPLHQLALVAIQRQLDRYVDANPGAVYFPDADLQLDRDLVYSPDLACYCAGRIRGVPALLTETPDLVIEILSPSTGAFDLTTKRGDYGLAGVREYWVVEPATGGVRTYVLEHHVLVERPADQARVASVALAGFVLDTAPIRELSKT